MARCLLNLLLLFLLFQQVYPQSSENGYPAITNADLQVKVPVYRKFTGTSLFGYIDGGAELYLEYGFSGALVNEISYKDGKYKIEIFKMTGPEEAFGIFSVSRYRCLTTPDISEYSCQSKYQLQFCKGPYYVSIINRTGTRTDSIIMPYLGKIISDKIADPEADLSVYLPGIARDLLRSSGFLAKGRLGIVNSLPDLEDLFRDIKDFTAVIMKDTDKTIISVKFNNPELCMKFQKLNNLKSSSEVSVRQIAENHLLIELKR